MTDPSPGGRRSLLGLVRAGDVRELFARYSDLALAALVVAIVGMMIIPRSHLILSI